ncbi:MAG: flagellar M-ring protein FliF [Bacteroidetes bacterium]|nr:flagellar M-ring protein FliF [Bacteroidota bacterium]
MNQLSEFFNRLTGKQKALIGTVTVAAFIGVMALVSVISKPSYGVLFSNLNQQDASKIVQILKEKTIPFTLDDDGKTILVPKEQLYELRLDMASAGLPNSSIIGYEIFDRTNLGISDFVQKVNYRRALEGELARTILNLNEVEGVRVHIVTPERALFKEDEKPPTASVVLKLRSGRPLKKEESQGIAHLVASSVEGMDASNVTILDTRGNVLSETNKSNSLAALTSTQYELQQKVENYLAEKAQRMMDGTLGMGNSFVQVNAELDFRQVEKNLEQYDGENPVVRSEQSTEEKTVIRDSIPPSTRSNSVTNYEISKTVEHIVENVGNIKRLSIATVINDKAVVKETDGVKNTEYRSRSAEEMQQITDIVKRSVGFDPKRNDDISVVNMPFDTMNEQLLVQEDPIPQEWNDIALKVVLIAAMAGAIVIIRSLLNRLKYRIEEPTNVTWGTRISGELEQRAPESKKIHLPPMESEVPIEVAIKAERRVQIQDYIKKQPDEASRLIKVWLSEEV